MAEQEGAVSIPLRWGPSEDVPATYVNQLMVSHDGPQFWMVFGLLDLHTEFRLLPEELDISFPEYLEIKPVVKLAIAPDAMVQFAEAIIRNVAKYKAQETTEADQATEKS